MTQQKKEKPKISGKFYSLTAFVAAAPWSKESKNMKTIYDKSKVTTTNVLQFFYLIKKPESS